MLLAGVLMTIWVVLATVVVHAAGRSGATNRHRRAIPIDGCRSTQNACPHMGNANGSAPIRRRPARKTAARTRRPVSIGEPRSPHRH